MPRHLGHPVEEPQVKEFFLGAGFEPQILFNMGFSCCSLWYKKRIACIERAGKERKGKEKCTHTFTYIHTYIHTYRVSYQKKTVNDSKKVHMQKDTSKNTKSAGPLVPVPWVPCSLGSLQAAGEDGRCRTTCWPSYGCLSK